MNLTYKLDRRGNLWYWEVLDEEGRVRASGDALTKKAAEVYARRAIKGREKRAQGWNPEEMKVGSVDGIR